MQDLPSACCDSDPHPTTTFVHPRSHSLYQSRILKPYHGTRERHEVVSSAAGGARSPSRDSVEVLVLQTAKQHFVDADELAAARIHPLRRVRYALLRSPRSQSWTNVEGRRTTGHRCSRFAGPTFCRRTAHTSLK